MQGNKENQEISVLGRLVSLEALVFVMGIASLVYGIATAGLVNIVIGVIIVAAAVMLARRWRQAQPK